MLNGLGNSTTRIILHTAEPWPCWRRPTTLRAATPKLSRSTKKSASHNRKDARRRPSVAVGLTDLAELYQDEERLTKRLNGRRAQKLRHRSLRWRHGQLKARGKLQR